MVDAHDISIERVLGSYGGMIQSNPAEAKGRTGA